MGLDQRKDNGIFLGREVADAFNGETVSQHLALSILHSSRRGQSKVWET